LSGAKQRAYFLSWAACYMKFTVVLFGFIPLFLTSLMPAANITVDDTTEDAGGKRQRVFRLAARTGPGEVLVVHSTRWENEVKVMEIEEVWSGTGSGSGCTIKLAELAPNYWQLVEPSAEQHLQGVTLARLERSAAGLDLELKPAPGGARRSYAFRWDAAVESWSTMKKRHPGLPAKTADGWPYRRILLPARPAKSR
jgi:hypothetical protein